MKKLWFKRKVYGWGWYPVTWQGWMVILLYVLAFAKISFFWNVYAHEDSNLLVRFVFPFIVLTSVLILICYKTGETPKWQWSGKNKNDPR